MSRVPPKNREVEKLLLEYGYVFKGQRGSHRQYEHPRTGVKVTVAGEPGDEMPRGTLRGVLKMAGIPKQVGW